MWIEREILIVLPLHKHPCALEEWFRPALLSLRELPASSLPLLIVTRRRQTLLKWSRVASGAHGGDEWGSTDSYRCWLEESPNSLKTNKRTAFIYFNFLHFNHCVSHQYKVTRLHSRRAPCFPCRSRMDPPPLRSARCPPSLAFFRPEAGIESAQDS